jgi:hypothetical protein
VLVPKNEKKKGGEKEKGENRKRTEAPPVWYLKKNSITKHTQKKHVSFVTANSL